MTRAEQKIEAVLRMKILKLHENVMRDFVSDNKLNLSENGGILYWLDEKQQGFVNEFEKKYNAVVYHVIHDYIEFGEILTFLYVSNTREEWESDREDLKRGYACVYVKNIDDDDCSEFGGVCFRLQFGGLVRTA